MKKTYLVILNLMILSWTQGQTTYLVKPDGSGDFSTIAAAVEGAIIGDTIELADGTFTGEGSWSIEVDKDLVIRSQSGDKEACIIDANGGPEDFRPVFVFEEEVSSNAVLRDFTIMRGSANAP